MALRVPSALARRTICSYCQSPVPPSRKTCPNCGSRSLTTLRGYWGVFEWERDGEYTIDDALSLHGSVGVATRLAGPFDVVRWVPSDGVDLFASAS